MHLQTVSLFGFKSFADRTDITIPPGISAIVGPNGCGKTNIADALRWALGEQSAKALRGQRMEDVIFHGSASRRPLGLAEVLLTFSNDGDLPVPWSEVSAGRRLYRDGESEYLLNKTACRLRDLQDLFLGTGVNPRAYALMEQERLAHILTSRPIDRRLFIEEAAGITRYKQQRAETLGKLEAARQNLVRVRDVMEEVRRQLGSLERQAKKATQYKALQAERRALALALTAAEHAALLGEEAALATQDATERQRVEALRARASALGAEQELLRAEAMAAEHELSDLRHGRERAGLEFDSCLARAEQLRQIEQDLAGETAHLDQEASALTTRTRELEVEQEASRTLHESLRVEFSALQSRADADEAVLHEIRARLRGHREEAERLRQQQVRLAGQRTELGQRLGALDERRGQLLRRIDRLQGERREVLEEAARLAEARTRAEAGAAEADTRVAALQERLADVSGRIAGSTRLRAAALGAVEEARVTLAGHRSSLALLEDLELQRVGYGHGVRAVLSAAGSTQLSGVVGTVADLLEVPEHLERAVEAALGERLQWVVVDTLKSAKQALAYLGQDGGGHATFLALDWLNGRPTTQVAEDEGVVGAAGALVASGHRGLVENLLGSVVIVRDLESAERLWNANGAATSYVTVGGEVLAPPGTLGGGRSTARGDASLLARKRTIGDLRRRVTTAEEAVATALRRAEEAQAGLEGLLTEQQRLTTDRERAEAERLSAAKDLERLLQDAGRAAVFEGTLEAEMTQLAAERQAVEGELGACRAERGDVEAAAEEAEAAAGRLRAAMEADESAEAGRAQTFLEAQVELAALAGRIDAAQAEAQRLRTEEAEARARIATGQERLGLLRERAAENAQERTRLDERAAIVQRQRDEAQAVVQAASERLQALTEQSHALADQVRAQEGELARATHVLGELAVRAAEARVRREDLEAEARRQFGVDSDTLRQGHDPARDLAASRARLEELGQRIAGMEPVNLIADEEYRELDERLTFLRAQHDDLTASMKDLERALRGMTRTAHTRFAEAFEAINRNFQELFARLFEGGRAELRLVDAPEEGDSLEPGIEMVAQPRGKRLQAISLLSGGEKALTGLALLFAIFYYRPSPFCLLDEVDAPLDDANIDRFTRVLRELAAQTQFIVITHNRKTMEAANLLYGVTMEEPGLSRIVGVDLS